MHFVVNVLPNAKTGLARPSAAGSPILEWQRKRS